MSLFTAVIFIVTLLFWRTFLNIATTNILLNGIIIGTTLFGIIICFANMFKLLPEYKWLHAYFDGRADYGYSPALLKPIAFALQNRHYKITTSNLTELLDLVAIRMDEKRENIRYITNTLIFLGLLGTFWGLILTVSGFAEILFNLNFDASTPVFAEPLLKYGPFTVWSLTRYARTAFGGQFDCRIFGYAITVGTKHYFPRFNRFYV